MPNASRPRLFLLSFLMLFVELALIRWLGANVIYLSYFSNFVLLGSFLGIGIGFLRARSTFDLSGWAPVALLALVGFVLAFPVQVQHAGEQLIYFGRGTTTGLPVWVTLPIVFLAAAVVMSLLGEAVARTFVTFEPLEAYRLDILGSIAGIGAFSVLSLLGSPPIGWGIVVAVCFALLELPRFPIVRLVPVVILLIVLGVESAASGVSWSPYYKISVVKTNPNTFLISANGVPHQLIEPVTQRRQRAPIYFLPYQRAAADPLNNVLIVGAGTGSDVAIALSEGAKHVDAVEIDPRLYELGKQLNPDHPYSDPRVDVHVDDGRAFLERTHTRYDLILFALPDSLTLVSGQSSLRLESYLFTSEAMASARSHLAPGGVFSMYNFYREQWLVDRLANTLRGVYGHAPCVDEIAGGGHLALLTVSGDPSAVSCPTEWKPQTAPAPATDDHPFVYLRTASIPAIYLVTLALILLVSLAAVRVVAGPFRGMAPYLDLFFMGAAFLLLETKNVVQFALLFGTTWMVNALAFAGILLAVLAAVETTRRIRIRRPALLYMFLLVSLAVAWAVPPHLLLDLALVPRLLAAVMLAFAPIFVANVIFADRFRASSSSAVAFGTNLLGAMVGGVLEYTALIVGYRALLGLAALLYLAALAFRPRGGSEAPSPAPAVKVGAGS
ncbi:MAG: spermidine synthase [Actinomycetota bacterium]|nr:spermidine synthase [Actinomycetota bacterium]